MSVLTIAVMPNALTAADGDNHTHNMLPTAATNNNDVVTVCSNDGMDLHALHGQCIQAIHQCYSLISKQSR
jgi:hypothetical protein